MASQTGRRAPNVSQYLKNLNAIQPEDDISNAQPDDFNFDRDLAVFTNADFANDNFLNQDLRAFASPPTRSSLGYQDDDFTVPNLASGWVPHDPLQPIATAIPSYDPTNTLTSPTTDFDFEVDPQPGSKRTASSLTPSTVTSPTDAQSHDDKARIAAEEDKRRRNTAASARFRVKKKEREQALEKSAKEMTDKVTALESRIDALETENQWLKELVVEKYGKGDLADKLQAFRRKSEEKEIEERRASEPKHGVGTSKRSKKEVMV